MAKAITRSIKQKHMYGCKVMRGMLLPLCVFLLYLQPAWSSKQPEVVLITHESSAIESLSLLEIRRLYLGFPISNKNIHKPVINRSTDKIYTDFLKNVMHMTEDGYRRKIIRRVFRYGSDYITELDSIELIVKHLEMHPNDVVFAYKEHVSHLENVKIVMRLW